MKRLGGINRLTLRLSLAITALVTGVLALGLHVLSEHHFHRRVEGWRRAAELQNRMLEAALRHQMLEKRANSTLIAAMKVRCGTWWNTCGRCVRRNSWWAITQYRGKRANIM